MSATATDDATWLLVLPKQHKLVPLSPIALTRAQASQRELQHAYEDALILDPRGLRRIEGVEVVGPYGESFARKLLSRLTSAWRLSVKLSEPLPWSLDDIKRLILDSLPTSDPWHDSDEPSAPSPAALAEAVRQATTPAEVLRALRLPKPEDALDGL